MNRTSSRQFSHVVQATHRFLDNHRYKRTLLYCVVVSLEFLARLVGAILAKARRGRHTVSRLSWTRHYQNNTKLYCTYEYSFEELTLLNLVMYAVVASNNVSDDRSYHMVPNVSCEQSSKNKHRCYRPHQTTLFAVEGACHCNGRESTANSKSNPPCCTHCRLS